MVTDFVDLTKLSDETKPCFGFVVYSSQAIKTGQREKNPFSPFGLSFVGTANWPLSSRPNMNFSCYVILLSRIVLVLSSVWCRRMQRCGERQQKWRFCPVYEGWIVTWPRTIRARWEPFCKEHNVGATCYEVISSLGKYRPTWNVVDIYRSPRRREFSGMIFLSIVHKCAGCSLWSQLESSMNKRPWLL